MGKFSINTAVRKLMRRQKINSTVLACRLGIKVRAVNETLYRDTPKVETCERYAEALGVTLLEFINEGYVK